VANEFQIELLRSYPGADMLPIDAEDHEAVDRAVREDATGDTLFAFLWKELGNAENASAADLLMSTALDDTRAVYDALVSSSEDENPKAVLARSYPGRDVIPVDLDDHVAVDRAVREGSTGDLLFSFLWRELGDADGVAEARRMAETALDDLQAVADSVRQPSPFA